MRTGYLVAAAAGIVHGGFSLYWAAGGTWLLGTVGMITEVFADARYLAFAVGVAKVAFALAPLLLDAELARWMYRAAGAVLFVWGAISMIGAALGLVLGGGNTEALLGHLLIWDPLFAVWGAAVVAGTFHREKGLAGTLVSTQQRQ